MIDLNRYRGCLLGLAVGDALGTTLEFKKRGSFTPIVDMLGGGPFNLKPGQWTDDTSMALCLATSLLEKNGFDPLDQMQRYLRWRDEGYLSSTGNCFDCGITISQALNRFQVTGQPFSGSTDPNSAGNGVIMRLAPVPMFYAPDLATAVEYSGESSRTTHGTEECVQACRLFGGMLARALGGGEKTSILFENHLTDFSAPKIAAIARGDYRNKTSAQIDGSGYVVESLEAALWCFLNTDSYREAVLAAANLGHDADTTAAVCGQIAGAYYGESGIPAEWLEKVYMRKEISSLAERLANH